MEFTFILQRVTVFPINRIFLLLAQPNFSDKEGLPLVVSDNLFRDIMQSTNFSSVTHDDGYYGPVI